MLEGGPGQYSQCWKVDQVTARRVDQASTLRVDQASTHGARGWTRPVPGGCGGQGKHQGVGGVDQASTRRVDQASTVTVNQASTGRVDQASTHGGGQQGGGSGDATQLLVEGAGAVGVVDLIPPELYRFARHTDRLAHR